MKYLLCIASLGLLMAGCATKKFVGAEIEASESRTQEQVEDLKELVEETQTEIRSLADELNLKIEGLESNTKDLGSRSDENAKAIAKMGQLTFKKTLSDAEAFFRSDSAELNETVRAELDKFATLIKSQNRKIHLEIQGHADNRGSESYNRILAENRARAVHDYLYKQHDIPLHLMNAISMGADDPIADNGTREGRAKNRRVVLVVRVQL